MTQIIGNAAELNDLVPDLKWHSTWDTPEAFARHIASLDKEKAWSDSGWDGDETFTGTKNMEEALKLAEGGWQEGAEHVLKLQGNILAANPQLPKTVKYSMAGSIPNVPRAIAGNPINMKALDLSLSRRRPVLTIMTAMHANWTISKDAITNRAAVVAAIIDMIEAAGYACEVIAFAPSIGHGENEVVSTSVIIKASTQPLDVARLAYGVGHSSMFRRLIFADWGSDPMLKKILGRGLGMCHFDVSKLQNTGIYVLPSVEDNRELFKDAKTSATKGLAFLIGKLRDQGCPAFTGPPSGPVNDLAGGPNKQRDLDDLIAEFGDM